MGFSNNSIATPGSLYYFDAMEQEQRLLLAHRHGRRFDGCCRTRCSLALADLARPTCNEWPANFLPPVSFGEIPTHAGGKRGPFDKAHDVLVVEAGRHWAGRESPKFHLILTHQRHTNGGRSAAGVAAMPIRKFLKPGMSFDDPAVAAMDAAFEGACKALEDTGQPYIVREIIAERIIEAARLGERDPARLVKAALPWLDRERD